MTETSDLPADTFVCVIDPDDSVCDDLCTLLCLMGCRVVTYSSAEEFLAASRIETPDCILAEFELPGISGLELQDRIKRESDCVPTLLFMTSNKVDIKTAVQAIRAGAADLIQKPFVDRVVLNRIRNALTSRRRFFRHHPLVSSQ